MFVSHKMREMLEMSERLTVIRNGQYIISGPTDDFTESSIANYMTGKTITTPKFSYENKDNVAPVMQINNLSHINEYENLNLKIMPGEIVGLSVCWVQDVRICFDFIRMRPHYTGEVLMDNKIVSLVTVQDAINHGIAYVPENRLSEGLFLTQPIENNILASVYEKLVRLISFDRIKGRELSNKMIETMQIATPSGDKIVGELSGGNQQRVVLARWFLTDIKVLILNGPTVEWMLGQRLRFIRK